jgi:glycosyltransferase involved in cell wall biosynthesis
MTKKKILWSGDVVAMTGFARVTENLITRLDDKYEIIVLGNNWWGDPAPELQNRFRMYPSSNRHQTEPFGVQRIREVVEREKPDIVFVNNDVWIVNQIYSQIENLHKKGDFKFVAYCPMDSYEWAGGLLDKSPAWDKLIIYTQFGAREFMNAGFPKEIVVIPHGVTTSQFTTLDKAECRRELGLKEESFIVFNGNRNQARKRQDVTIEAFAKFAEDKPDAMLYMHMGLKDQGWDIMSLFAQEMNKRGIDANGRIIMTSNSPHPPNVPVRLLNVIYNAVDVGVNTCKGEGHGLVNHEHAACGVAQVVPDHTSLKEIFHGAGLLIDTAFVDVDMNFNRRMPVPSADHLAEILNDLYHDREKLKAIGMACKERALDPMYQWETIAANFEEVFDEVLEEKVDTEQAA